MHTDIEEGPEVVVLSLVNPSLFKQTQQGRISQSRLVNLKESVQVKDPFLNRHTKSNRFIADSKPITCQYSFRLSCFSFSGVNGPNSSPWSSKMRSVTSAYFSLITLSVSCVEAVVES